MDDSRWPIAITPLDLIFSRVPCANAPEGAAQTRRAERERRKCKAASGGSGGFPLSRERPRSGIRRAGGLDHAGTRPQHGESDAAVRGPAPDARIRGGGAAL